MRYIKKEDEVTFGDRDRVTFGDRDGVTFMTNQKPSNKEIKNLAIQFLKKHNLRMPFDVQKAADAVGAVIQYHTMPASVSGVTLFSKPAAGQKHHLIGISKSQTEGRKRFTIAHEIAHITLKHNKQKKSLFLQSEDSHLERQANIFASELLMPTCHIKDLIISGLKDVDILADIFGVSKSAMSIKLQECGVDVDSACPPISLP